jgi:hypothetical protein
MHFATFLQYVFPMIFLVATVVSFVRRWRSIALFDDVRVDPTANIAVLSWQDFETLVGDGFRHRGFKVAERGGAAPDGGVDLELAGGQSAFRFSASNGGRGRSVFQWCVSSAALWRRSGSPAGMW